VQLAVHGNKLLITAIVGGFTLLFDRPSQAGLISDYIIRPGARSGENVGQIYRLLGVYVGSTNLQIYGSAYGPAGMYRVSQKSSPPPTTFNDIFAWSESFCIKFCTFIGNLYPHMSTDFRSFILTFNEMASILLRAPIILRFQVWIVQQGIQEKESLANANVKRATAVRL